MRILRIEAEGIFLFEGKAVIDFNAEQRVYPDNAAMLYNPFGNTYTNNVLSFVGVNASGKTTTLKLISFVMSLLNAEAINTIDTKVILEKSTKVVLKTYFYDEKAGVCLLETVIGVTKEEGAVDRYTILHERLYIRKAGSITSKANLFQFANNDLYNVAGVAGALIFCKIVNKAKHLGVNELQGFHHLLHFRVGGAVGTHHDHHAVGLPDNGQGVRHHIQRRCINDHIVVVPADLLQKLSHGLAAQQLCRIGWNGTGAQQR